MPEYTHTLIPDRPEFVPEPEQVAAFFSSLVSIGAAPLTPTFIVYKPSGALRTFKNPFTGKTESFAMREADKLLDLGAVPRALKALDDYEVTVAGKGPPERPAFQFDFNGTYDFLVRCCLRAVVVSTSDWHDEVPIQRRVEFFARPCSPKDRLGVYVHPNKLTIIEVPNAGCARFWIEFEFGKMLFPAIEDRLDLIERRIVEIAESDLGATFTQGCRWCA
jgi:hypothetical protein